MGGVLEALPPKIVTLGGEITANQIPTELHKHFPDARLTHIYASTEFGIGFAINDGKAGFPAAYADDNNGVLVSKTGELKMPNAQGRLDRHRRSGQAPWRPLPLPRAGRRHDHRGRNQGIPRISRRSHIRRPRSVHAHGGGPQQLHHWASRRSTRRRPARQQRCRPANRSRPRSLPRPAQARSGVRIVYSLPITGASKFDHKLGNVSLTVD